MHNDSVLDQKKRDQIFGWTLSSPTYKTAINLYYGAELKFLEQGWLVLVVGCFFHSVFITCPSQDGQVAAEASSGKPLHGVFHYLFYHYNLVLYLYHFFLSL